MEFEKELENYRGTCMSTYVEQLKELVKIPSISQDPNHKEDHQKVLEKISEYLEEYGFINHIIQTKGNPCLVSHLEVDSTKPWITIYNHMDVQPAKEPQWIQEDPFEPLEKENAIFGRGSTDDKGPALTIVHAVNFLREQNIEMPNIQIIYETEEEIGSTHFGAFLDENQDLIKASESILVSDTIFEGDNPALTYKLKGLARCYVYLKTGSEDLHSGMVGGVAANAHNILTHLLGKCVDDEGNITIPDFYDEVKELTPREVKELETAAQHFDVEKFSRDLKDATLYVEKPLEILKRIWYKPTLEIHGYAGGQSEDYNEEGKMILKDIKTAIPYEAAAKITMRLVANLTPQSAVEKLERYLKSLNKNIVVELKEGAHAATADLENEFMDKAAQACEKGFGKPCLFVGTGGTIGSIPEFQRVYPGVPVVLLAQSLMSDNYHGPNENFKLQQAKAGMKAVAIYLNSIANLRS